MNAVSAAALRCFSRWNDIMAPSRTLPIRERKLPPLYALPILTDAWSRRFRRTSIHPYVEGDGWLAAEPQLEGRRPAAWVGFFLTALSTIVSGLFVL